MFIFIGEILIFFTLPFDQAAYNYLDVQRDKLNLEPEGGISSQSWARPRPSRKEAPHMCVKGLPAKISTIQPDK